VLETQWAAVAIQRLFITDPPQKKLFPGLVVNMAIQGQSLTPVSTPPRIQFSLDDRDSFTPHSQFQGVVDAVEVVAGVVVVVVVVDARGPVVVVGGEGEGAGVLPTHSIVQVAEPDESFLSDMNINFIGFVLWIDGDLDLQKNCFPTFSLSPFLHFFASLFGRSKVVQENLSFLHLVFLLLLGLYMTEHFVFAPYPGATSKLKV